MRYPCLGHGGRMGYAAVVAFICFACPVQALDFRCGPVPVRWVQRAVTRHVYRPQVTRQAVTYAEHMPMGYYYGGAGPTSRPWQGQFYGQPYRGAGGSRCGPGGCR